jgi:hypothetical protein
MIDAQWIYAHHYVLGTERVFDFDLYSPDGSGVANLGCTYAWCKVSVDGGATWSDVPTNVQSGLALGPLAAGQRKQINVKLLIPPGTSVRTRSVGLPIGLGT